MPTIIADCSPLIALSGIHRLPLLEKMFGAVFVPPAVYREAVTNGGGWLHARDLQAALAQSIWLSVHPLLNDSLPPGLPRLGAGEAEAVLLAKELSLPLLIDERKGRIAAKLHGVDFFGTLGVLARAKALQLIDKAKPLVDSMETNGYRFHPALKKSFLDRSGEA